MDAWLNAYGFLGWHEGDAHGHRLHKDRARGFAFDVATSLLNGATLG